MKFLRIFAILLFFVFPCASDALTVGTFNIEYFTVNGESCYTTSDMKELSEKVLKSGADLIALQEVEGDETMKAFMKFLPQWEFSGNDTGSRQDLYFIWNTDTVELVSEPEPQFSKSRVEFAGKNYKLFDRPPLVAVFRERSSKKELTLVNVHLKSNVAVGKGSVEEADAYNKFKRKTQIAYINKFVSVFTDAVLILGDYNSSSPLCEGVAFNVITIPDGYTYDRTKSNFDYIGFSHISKKKFGVPYEVESKIPSRSSGKAEHPDHDLVAVKVNL